MAVVIIVTTAIIILGARYRSATISVSQRRSTSVPEFTTVNAVVKRAKIAKNGIPNRQTATRTE